MDLSLHISPLVAVSPSLISFGVQTENKQHVIIDMLTANRIQIAVSPLKTYKTTASDNVASFLCTHIKNIDIQSIRSASVLDKIFFMYKDMSAPNQYFFGLIHNCVITQKTIIRHDCTSYNLIDIDNSVYVFIKIKSDLEYWLTLFIIEYNDFFDEQSVINEDWHLVVTKGFCYELHKVLRGDAVLIMYSDKDTAVSILEIKSFKMLYTFKICNTNIITFLPVHYLNEAVTTALRNSIKPKTKHTSSTSMRVNVLNRAVRYNTPQRPDRRLPFMSPRTPGSPGVRLNISTPEQLIKKTIEAKHIALEYIYTTWHVELDFIPIETAMQLLFETETSKKAKKPITLFVHLFQDYMLLPADEDQPDDWIILEFHHWEYDGTPKLNKLKELVAIFGQLQTIPAKPQKVILYGPPDITSYFRGAYTWFYDTDTVVKTLTTKQKEHIAEYIPHNFELNTISND